jgi:Clp amino terminal domain, pathogenicity island component
VPGPGATPEYAREAVAAAAAAMEDLTAVSKRCLDEAQRQSRQLDDNHVGTEHIVLGVLAADRDIAGMLALNGITETVFRAQLFEEPGPSPDGHIPLTSRALMILGLARSAAAGDGGGGGAICPRHLMLGVIAESSDWRRRGFDGPHHLEQAAAAAGTSLATIQFILSRP